MIFSDKLNEELKLFAERFKSAGCDSVYYDDISKYFSNVLFSEIFSLDITEENEKSFADFDITSDGGVCKRITSNDGVTIGIISYEYNLFIKATYYRYGYKGLTVESGGLDEDEISRFIKSRA